MSRILAHVLSRRRPSHRATDYIVAHFHFDDVVDVLELPSPAIHLVLDRAEIDSQVVEPLCVRIHKPLRLVHWVKRMCVRQPLLVVVTPRQTAQHSQVHMLRLNVCLLGQHLV